MTVTEIPVELLYRAPRPRLPRFHIEHRPGRPLLVDLFCCDGGTSMGYWRAGFNVIGVDHNPRPYYPFPFVLADALEYELPPNAVAVAASPPCQRFSRTTAYPTNHPDLIEPTRRKLKESGLPYVMENIPEAPLVDPLLLCGSMFPELSVLRHRHFESNMELTAPARCDHDPRTLNQFNPYNTAQYHRWIRVHGSPGGSSTRDGIVFARTAEWRRAMDISWMTGAGLSQAIPPPYTEWIGRQLPR